MQTKLEQKEKQKITGKVATKTIAILGVLTALGVICTMPFPYGLTIRFGNSIKLSFTFLVVALAARKYGPIAGGVVAGLADIIQTLVSGYGAPNPLICLSGILGGVIYGLCLHKKASFTRVLIAVLAKMIICSTLLTTLALSLMYGAPFIAKLIERLPQLLTMTVIEIVVMYVLFVKTNILVKIKYLDE